MKLTRTIFIAFVALLVSGAAAFATSCPSFYYGKVLTAAEWQACFDAKQNALGYTPVNRAGDSMTGKLNTLASTSSVAGLNVAPGTAPASPVNGDLWATTAGLYARINGATVQLSAPVGDISIATTVDFNATGDTAIAITLPYGFTRYLVKQVLISGADHPLTTATAGLFTAAAGAGVAIVTAASAITVSSIADATIDNAQAMTVNDDLTRSYLQSGAPTLYFNVGTVEGAVATATVTIKLTPLP